MSHATLTRPAHTNSQSVMPASHALTGHIGDDTGLVSDEVLQAEVDAHPDLPNRGITFRVIDGRFEAVYAKDGEFVFDERHRRRRPAPTSLDDALTYALVSWPNIQRAAARLRARRKRSFMPVTHCRECRYPMTQESDIDARDVVTHCEMCGWIDMPY